MRSLPVLVLTLSFSLVFAACGGSRGEFVPYTNGSQISKGEPKAAYLVVVHKPANCVISQDQYDLTIKFSDDVRPPILLGFITDGEFSVPGSSSVQLTTGRKFGMTVETGDVLLQELIDKAVIVVTFAPKTRQTAKEVYKTDYNYKIEVTLSDAQGRVLGEFNQTITDHTDTSYGGAAAELRPEGIDPRAPSGIFDWVRARAKK
jgi:hypothetical protein